MDNITVSNDINIAYKFEDHTPIKLLLIYPWKGDTENNRITEKFFDWDLSAINDFRFDLINACNIRCAFCFTGHTKNNLEIDKVYMERILIKLQKESTLIKIQVGCLFEPLLSKRFSLFGSMIEEKFKDKNTEITITTNGTLLHKQDISSYVRAGGKRTTLHLSMHSHRSDVFSSMVKGINYDKLVQNIRITRLKYPEIKVHFCCILVRENYNNFDGYLKWAFNEMGADIIEFRRPYMNHLDKERKCKLEISTNEFFNLHNKIKHMLQSKDMRHFKVSKIKTKLYDVFWVKKRRRLMELSSNVMFNIWRGSVYFRNRRQILPLNLFDQTR